MSNNLILPGLYINVIVVTIPPLPQTLVPELKLTVTPLILRIELILLCTVVDVSEKYIGSDASSLYTRINDPLQPVPHVHVKV